MTPQGVNEEMIEAIEKMVRASKGILGLEINRDAVKIFIQRGMSENQILAITKNAEEILGGITEYEILLPTPN